MDVFSIALKTLIAEPGANAEEICARIRTRVPDVDAFPTSAFSQLSIGDERDASAERGGSGCGTRQVRIPGGPVGKREDDLALAEAQLQRLLNGAHPEERSEAAARPFSRHPLVGAKGERDFRQFPLAVLVSISFLGGHT